MNSQPDLSSRLAIDTQGVDQLRQSSKKNSAQSVKAVAQQFEALFMNSVMKSMRDASTQEGGVFDNQQSKMFTGMLDQQLSQNMAKRGVGLADVLIRQLSPHGVVSPEEAAKNPITKFNGDASKAASPTLIDTANNPAINSANKSAINSANKSVNSSVNNVAKSPLNTSLISSLNKTATSAQNKLNNDAFSMESKPAATALSPARAKLLADLQAMSDMDANFRADSPNKSDDISGLSQLGNFSPAALSQYLDKISPKASNKVQDGKVLNIDDGRPNLRKGINVNAVNVSSVTGSRQPAHVREFQTKLAAQADEASRTTGIPAKFLLGQAALESGWGKREIKTADGKPSHNLFGIKAGPSWKGKVVETMTTEYVNGVPQARREKFRAYDSYTEAFRDYGRLLSKNPRYENVIANAQDASSFARGLQRAGYATDPNYAAKLTRIINNSLS